MVRKPLDRLCLSGASPVERHRVFRLKWERVQSMKMLMLVFLDSIEEEVLEQLHTLGVTAYTRMDDVAGVGRTGVSHARFPGSQDNTVILTALPDEQAASVIKGLRQFHAHKEQDRHTHMPLHVFILPCEQVF